MGFKFYIFCDLYLSIPKFPRKHYYNGLSNIHKIFQVPIPPKQKLSELLSLRCAPHCIVYKRIRCTTWQCWLFWCKISSQKEARTKCQNVRNVGIWYIVTSACETMKLDAIKMLLYRVPAIYVLHSFSSRTVQNVRMVSEAGYNCWFPIILLLKRKSTYV